MGIEPQRGPHMTGEAFRFFLGEAQEETNTAVRARREGQAQDSKIASQSSKEGSGRELLDWLSACSCALAHESECALPTFPTDTP